jgi:hypothetical protein
LLLSAIHCRGFRGLRSFSSELDEARSQSAQGAIGGTLAEDRQLRCAGASAHQRTSPEHRKSGSYVVGALKYRNQWQSKPLRVTGRGRQFPYGGKAQIYMRHATV